MLRRVTRLFILPRFGVRSRRSVSSNPELPPIDYQPKKYTGPSAEEILKTRDKFLNPGIFKYYKKPLMLVCFVTTIFYRFLIRFGNHLLLPYFENKR
jgi:hypothetical protein